MVKQYNYIYFNKKHICLHTDMNEKGRVTYLNAQPADINGCMRKKRLRRVTGTTVLDVLLNAERQYIARTSIIGQLQFVAP